MKRHDVGPNNAAMLFGSVVLKVWASVGLRQKAMSDQLSPAASLFHLGRFFIPQVVVLLLVSDGLSSR